MSRMPREHICRSDTMTPNTILTRALNGAGQRQRKDDDVWLDELRARCAKAIARYLQQGINLQRPIATLTAQEMHGMAEAATAEWIKAVSERLQETRIIGDSQLSPELGDHYTAVLMGG